MMFSSRTFVGAGTKRKRSASGAENATSTSGRAASQRATRGTVPRGRFKRQKSESILGSSGSDDDPDERSSVSTKTTDTISGEEDDEVDLVDTDDDDDSEEDNEDAETVGSAMEVDVDEVDGPDALDETDSENDSEAGDSCESEHFPCPFSFSPTLCSFISCPLSLFLLLFPSSTPGFSSRRILPQRCERKGTP